MANVCASYRLDFASGAWRQIGAFEGAAFKQLTRELREIAARAPHEAFPRRAARRGQREPSPARQQVTAAGYAAIYELDHTTGTVLVVDVIRVGTALAK